MAGKFPDFLKKGKSEKVKDVGAKAKNLPSMKSGKKEAFGMKPGIKLKKGDKG